MTALAKSRLGGLGLPSWLSDWLGKDLEDVYKEKYGGRYPGLAENVAVGTGSALKAVGVPKRMAETAGRNVTSLAEDWTPAGALTATEEYGPVGGLAAVPIVGAKGKKVVKGLGKLAEERLPNVEKTAAAVVDPVAPQGLGGPSKELDEIVAAGEAAALQPKVEPIQTAMARKAPYDVMGKDDWARFNKAHTTGEGIADVELPIRALNVPHDVNPDFAAAAARYGGGGTEARPLVIRKGGQYYVADGVHRLVAAEKVGQEMANVRLVDLDRTRQQK